MGSHVSTLVEIEEEFEFLDNVDENNQRGGISSIFYQQQVTGRGDKVKYNGKWTPMRRIQSVPLNSKLLSHRTRMSQSISDFRSATRRKLSSSTHRTKVYVVEVDDSEDVAENSQSKPSRTSFPRDNDLRTTLNSARSKSKVRDSLHMSATTHKKATEMISSREIGHNWYMNDTLAQSDDGLPELLDNIGVRPSFDASSLLRTLFPSCGVEGSVFYPRVDYFILRICESLSKTPGSCSLCDNSAKESEQPCFRCVATQTIDKSGNTLLLQACQNESIILISYLLQHHGALFSTQDTNHHGQSALHVILTGTFDNFRRPVQETLPLVEVLVRHGTSPHSRDSRMCTPLHYAAVAGDTLCVALLIFLRVFPDSRDQNGRRAIDYSKQLGHNKCTRFMQWSTIWRVQVASEGYPAFSSTAVLGSERPLLPKLPSLGRIRRFHKEHGQFESKVHCYDAVPETSVIIPAYPIIGATRRQSNRTDEMKHRQSNRTDEMKHCGDGFKSKLSVTAASLQQSDSLGHHRNEGSSEQRHQNLELVPQKIAPSPGSNSQPPFDQVKYSILWKSYQQAQRYCDLHFTKADDDVQESDLTALRKLLYKAIQDTPSYEPLIENDGAAAAAAQVA